MVKRIKICIFLSTVFFVFSCGNFAYAESSSSNDLGLWTAVNVRLPITEKFQSRFQFSPRWLDNSTDFNQFILHALLGYKFNEHLSFYQGYAWSTLYIPNFRREQRPYQELIISHDVNKISFEHRFRFEERFLQSIEGISLRGRYRLKGIYPLDKNEKWSLVLFDELFLNLNSHFDGPQAGIDQNRVYAGINHKFNENISADLGYQLQQLKKSSFQSNRLNHFIFFYLNFDLPALVEKRG
jgi:hypothetical protein